MRTIIEQNDYCYLAALAAILAIALPAFSQSEIGTPRLMQGPMVGAVTDDSISIWIRVSGPYRCQLEVDRRPDFASPILSEPVHTKKENDYCATLTIGNLQPDTRYYYRISVNSDLDSYSRNRMPFYTKTAPPTNRPTRFSIAFGSCARIQRDREQAIWNIVNEWNPDLFFWLGDNVYADTLDADIIAEEYRRQRELASIQSLLCRVPQLAIWDDHDYGLNDHDKTNPIKQEALEIFRLYWPNLSYGLPSVPGVFFKYRYGHVDFFFLDVRYHRDPNRVPDSPEKTMLGKQQLSWLKEELAASDAVFKILISGSGWTKAKGMGGDSWSSFIAERNDLFDYIRDREISGVVLLSGDTHVGELNCVPWSEQGGYDLYDLVSSPLAQSPGTGWFARRPEIRIRPLYYSSPNFGFIEFEIGESPSLRFNLVDPQGYTVWEPFVLHSDELKNGIGSWTQKIDPNERARMEREKKGEGYYDR